MVLTELRGQGTSQVVDYKEPKRARLWTGGWV